MKVKRGQAISNMGSFRKALSMYTVRALFFVSGFVVVICMITIFLVVTVMNGLYTQQKNNAESAIKVYVSELDNSILQVTKRIAKEASENYDFSYLNDADIARENYYKMMESVVSVRHKMDDIRTDNGLVSGVYIDYPNIDMFLVSNNDTTGNSMVVLQEYVRDTEKSDEAQGAWKFVDTGEMKLLVYVRQFRNAYYGAWFDIDNCAKEFSFYDTDMANISFFCDKEGTVIGPTDRLADNFPDKVSSENSWSNSKGFLYEVARVESAVADYEIAQLIPLNSVLSGVPSLIWILVILTVLSILMVPAVIYVLNKWMVRPITDLNLAMDEIGSGNVDYRIKESGAIGEFEKLNHEFNKMMDDVQRLQQGVYEERLKEQNVRLKFLSQQIQPHFIMNTLNILYSYEQDEYPLIQKMLINLSRYFAYIVNASRDEVLLKEEMKHIQNYFAIQKVRYPDTFSTIIEWEDEVANCLIPPLLIQNFAENTIKHSIRIGEEIQIIIIARRYDKNPNKVQVLMLDTGKGINEETLAVIHRFQETGVRDSQLGVGIQNAIERLKILYGVETRLEIMRDEPHGTRIEIILPLKLAEDEEDDE